MYQDKSIISPTDIAAVAVLGDVGDGEVGGGALGQHALVDWLLMTAQHMEPSVERKKENVYSAKYRKYNVQRTIY